MMFFKRIVSGGQSGVDRAALDVAMEFDVDSGGWVPKGRLAEDGPLTKKYRVIETPSDDNAVRTEWNVRDSRATLLITDGEATGGSALTLALAEKMKRPHLHVDLSKTTIPQAVDAIVSWLSSGRYEILNVAGPRLSESPGIYDKARSVLGPVFAISRTHASSDDVEVALKVYEQACNNFRHWDQIRWLVPYWFATIAAAEVALLQLTVQSGRDPDDGLRVSAVLLALFSALCVGLMFNTIVNYPPPFSARGSGRCG